MSHGMPVLFSKRTSLNSHSWHCVSIDSDYATRRQRTESSFRGKTDVRERAEGGNARNRAPPARSRALKATAPSGYERDSPRRDGTTNVLSPVIGVWKDKRVQCNYPGLNRRRPTGLTANILRRRCRACTLARFPLPAASRRRILRPASFSASFPSPPPPLRADLMKLGLDFLPC